MSIRATLDALRRLGGEAHYTDIEKTVPNARARLGTLEEQGYIEWVAPGRYKVREFPKVRTVRVLNVGQSASSEPTVDVPAVPAEETLRLAWLDADHDRAIGKLRLREVREDLQAAKAQLRNAVQNTGLEDRVSELARAVVHLEERESATLAELQRCGRRAKACWQAYEPVLLVKGALKDTAAPSPPWTSESANAPAADSPSPSEASDATPASSSSTSTTSSDSASSAESEPAAASSPSPRRPAKSRPKPGGRRK
jgi:hypothetical protein